MLAWTAFVIAMPLLGIGGLKVEGTGAKAFAKAARAASHDHNGNLALVLIEDGTVAQSHAMSIGKPVSGDTMFQLASVSKWVTTWGVMTLVEEGRIDLDAPVSRYLKRWQLPPGDYPAAQVTVRRLLSHTAGLTDDLGYCGFAPGTPIQTLEASLTKAADACPLRTGAVQVGAVAGSWRYSGGGFTLLQLLIEEVSGDPFADYMQRTVLAPLGMSRSTFRTGAEGYNDIAQFFDSDGKPAPHNHYSAAAAASLYSSANDMARFARAHMVGLRGEGPGRGVLSPQSIAAIRTTQSSLLGTPHWGMGVQLYASSARGGAIYGHEGGNVPAVNNSVRIEQATGDAIIALSTGGSTLASKLGSTWTRQRRAGVTPAMIHGAVMRLTNPFEAFAAWAWLLGGWAMIMAVSVVAARRRRAHPSPRA
jgi:CubicO group peptidase (beta-lactamase class C family)